MTFVGINRDGKSLGKAQAADEAGVGEEQANLRTGAAPGSMLEHCFYFWILLSLFKSFKRVLENTEICEEIIK